MDKKAPSRAGTDAQAGKTIRYFKYALGEVILVVIGILIALQINNWNTGRNDDKKVEKYLSEVQNNIQIDIARIDNRVHFSTIKIEKLKRTILYYYKAVDEPRYLDSIRAFIVSGQIGRISDFYPSKSGIEALLGSGDINLISDSIRIKLNEYYELNNDFRSMVERVTNLTRNVIQDRLLKQVVNKSFIEDYIELEIPSENLEAEKSFKPESDMTTDIMFLSIIVNSYIEDLLELKGKGFELIQTIQKN
jgi:hypothetical protein